jgi:hypothetical protein
MLVRTHHLRGLCLRFTFIISLLSSGYANAAPIYSYKVVATYPHSTDSYTEGFFYLDGIFYEGIGINGRSAVMAIAPETGRTLLRHDLPSEYFGEGIVAWGPNVYEWTWKAREAVHLYGGGVGHDSYDERAHHQRRHGYAFASLIPFGKPVTSLQKTAPKSSTSSMHSSSSKTRFMQMSGTQT